MILNIDNTIIIIKNFINDNKIVFIIMIALILLSTLLANVGDKKKKKQTIYEKKYNDPLLEINNNNDIINKEELSQLAFQKLKELKLAKMNFDFNTIRNITNNEIFELYSKQIQTLKNKKQKNIVQNIKYINSHITNIITNESNQIINFRITIECYDFTTDNYNNAIDKNYNQKLLQTYEIEIKKKLNTIQNCTIEKLQLLYERKI